jgi:hypothetical protein
LGDCDYDFASDRLRRPAVLLQGEAHPARLRVRAAAAGPARILRSFMKNRNNPAVQHKWYLANREDAIRRSKAYKKEHPEVRRKHRRKARGVKNPTGETKHGPCELCGQVKNLQLDHDHETGCIRGWLCVRCNIALGWLEILLKGRFLTKFRRYLKERGINRPDMAKIDANRQESTHKRA